MWAGGATAKLDSHRRPTRRCGEPRTEGATSGASAASEVPETEDEPHPTTVGKHAQDSVSLIQKDACCVITTEEGNWYAPPANMQTHANKLLHCKKAQLGREGSPARDAAGQDGAVADSNEFWAEWMTRQNSGQSLTGCCRRQTGQPSRDVLVQQ
eukprot:2588084-Pyramimonas_sp.AAC.1